MYTKANRPQGRCTLLYSLRLSHKVLPLACGWSCVHAFVETNWEYIKRNCLYFVVYIITLITNVYLLQRIYVITYYLLPNCVFVLKTKFIYYKYVLIVLCVLTCDSVYFSLIIKKRWHSSDVLAFTHAPVVSFHIK